MDSGFWKVAAIAGGCTVLAVLCVLYGVYVLIFGGIVMTLVVIRYLVNPILLQKEELRTLQIENGSMRELAQLDAARILLNLQRYPSAYLLEADEQGNYPQVVANGQVIQIAPGNGPSMRQIAAPRRREEYVEQEEIEESKAEHACTESPDFRWLLGQAEPDSLIIPIGIDETSGKTVFYDIVQCPHSKIIGAPGFGKSCLAALMMDAASQLNSPDRLQLAILDMENKTSRLFAKNNNIFEAQIGRRSVPIFARNPDQVAEYLRFLKLELDYRANLSEYDLDRLPVIQIYIEEMLSLQIEVDDRLLAQMLADIEVLAVRGRKYGMFLLACLQVDYSTKEMKNTQKMFRYRAAAGIDATAARAAGFQDGNLIKQNFAHAAPGRFLIEYPGFSSLVRVGKYDLKTKLRQAEALPPVVVQSVQPRARIEPTNNARTAIEHTEQNTTEQATQAVLADLEAKAEQVRRFQAKGWVKSNIIPEVWGATRGSSKAYQQAELEYETILLMIKGEA